jgi:hypothetical protein
LYIEKIEILGVFVIPNCEMTSSAASPQPSSQSSYKTYQVYPWHTYQQFNDKPTEQGYISDSAAQSKLYDPHVKFLREEIVKITGWYWQEGWSPYVGAETNGYVDVRTGKKYPEGTRYLEDVVSSPRSF